MSLSLLTNLTTDMTVNKSAQAEFNLLLQLKLIIGEKRVSLAYLTHMICQFLLISFSCQPLKFKAVMNQRFLSNFISCNYENLIVILYL
jgi:hypothetical protein